MNNDVGVSLSDKQTLIAVVGYPRNSGNCNNYKTNRPRYKNEGKYY